MAHKIHLILLLSFLTIPSICGQNYSNITPLTKEGEEYNLNEKMLKKDKVINESKMNERIIKIVPEREPDRGIEITMESTDRNKRRFEVFLVNDFPYLL